MRGKAHGRSLMNGCAGSSCAKEPPGEVCNCDLTSILPLVRDYVHMQDTLVSDLTNALCRLMVAMVQSQ